MDKFIVVHYSCLKPSLPGIETKSKGLIQYSNVLGKIDKIVSQKPTFTLDWDAWYEIPEDLKIPTQMADNLRGSSVMFDEVSANALRDSNTLPLFLEGVDSVGLMGAFRDRCVSAVGRVLERYPVAVHFIEDAIV